SPRMRLIKAPSGAATSRTRKPSSAPGGLSWLAAVIGAPEAIGRASDLHYRLLSLGKEVVNCHLQTCHTLCAQRIAAFRQQFVLICPVVWLCILFNDALVQIDNPDFGNA